MSGLLKDLWVVDVESTAGPKNEVIQACALRMDAVIACARYADVHWMLSDAFNLAGEKGVLCPSGKPVLGMDHGNLKMVAAALRTVLGANAPRGSSIDIGRLPTQEKVSVTGAYIHGFTEERLAYFYGSGIELPDWSSLWDAMTAPSGYTGFFVDGDRAQLDAVPPGRQLPVRVFDVQRLYTWLLGPDSTEGSGMDTALLYMGAVDPLSRVAYRGTHDGLVDCFLTGLLILKWLWLSKYNPVMGDASNLSVSVLKELAGQRQLVRKWKFGKFAGESLLAADAGYLRWYAGNLEKDANKKDQQADILWSYAQLLKEKNESQNRPQGQKDPT
jgi:hypothetical protein